MSDAQAADERPVVLERAIILEIDNVHCHQAVEPVSKTGKAGAVAELTGQQMDQSFGRTFDGADGGSQAADHLRDAHAGFELRERKLALELRFKFENQLQHGDRTATGCFPGHCKFGRARRQAKRRAPRPGHNRRQRPGIGNVHQRDWPASADSA
jgi:hypothetical protein